MIFEMMCTEPITKLFEGWNDVLVRSCLQKTMGHLYSTSVDMPVSAMAVLGDFCFLSGRPDHELTVFIPNAELGHFRIMVSRDNFWQALIEKCHRGRVRRVRRYSFRMETGCFNSSRLQRFVDCLSGEYLLKTIDEQLFFRCKTDSYGLWLKQYDDYGSFQMHGAGVVVFHRGRIISGAVSYAGCSDSIDIQVDTHKNYRRRGLATACAARLILDCIEKGKYPSWDAENVISLSLAEKLGYRLEHAYTAWEICG